MRPVTLKLKLSNQGIAQQVAAHLIRSVHHRHIKARGVYVTTVTTLEAAVIAVSDKRVVEYTITSR